ncbi:MAG TPA: DNA-directed RNA polymerase subunit beta' [Verrucomicrobiota bacterium]|nr:DNA-directed RNA polymerase subunit beta' [Verrucomicrobiota bacterium]HNU50246.1 DNA-directed RNA polymerase subunit beta' [Verrucomicrobiota bacterium]
MLSSKETARELLGLEKVNLVEHVAISVASPETIRSWSKGEVKNPETINYRTFKPEKGGLFCERIFGPVKDWECSCGKYKRIKHRGVVCDRCGVEVTLSRVRRERMGHIDLAVPVSHIWFFKCMPSRIGLMLDMTARNLERVIYYEDYLVIDPGSTTPLKGHQLLSETEYREAQRLYGADAFVAKMGAEAVRDALARLDLQEEIADLQRAMGETRSKQIRKKLAKRIKLFQGFLGSRMRPEWMILTVLPVIPPDLRPLVPLEGGRFATSDLNDLYRRVINRNNRLKNLLQLKTPEVIIRNEKRMLQEAVDALFDNGRHGRAVTGAGNRALKSLSDMLKGKSGRFRQNLLGKRVDYSGRSVIVIGPELRLHQCGLPKKMALVLFEPFIIRRLKELGYVHTVRSAKKMIERQSPEVWDILEEVTKGHPVLLNRAPTLHRLSIQAFEPVLIEGEAIRIHPLVCTAYNADFDGDQMAVHVPLSVEAQMEARLLMMAPLNIFSPSSGRPIMTPTQDITLGCYYLTAVPRVWQDREKGYRKFTIPEFTPEAFFRHKLVFHASEREVRRIKLFATKEEVISAHIDGTVLTHEPVYLVNPDYQRHTVYGDSQRKVIGTTVGRVIFSEVWPAELGFFNDVAGKAKLGDIIWNCYKRCGHVRAIAALDHLKELGFREATRSGCSIGIDDMIIPQEKTQQIKGARQQIDDTDKQYRRGIITPGERYNKIIDIWTHCTDEIAKVMLKTLEDNQGKREYNPVWLMVDSGARGNKAQVRQLAGVRGLMAKPDGSIIEQPILSNFREGLSVLEYFISTHGARKGLADTALKTADSGYMTRKLVDVAQDVIIRTEDCGTTNGIWVQAIYEGEDEVVRLSERLIGRMACDDIIDRSDPKRRIVRANEEIDEVRARAIEEAGIERVRIRSVLTCESKHGVCIACYGRNLATGGMVKLGEAVGIIAAQSIGEPGTQLTMRTFHIGGTASQVFKQPQIRAKHNGTIRYNDLRTVRLPDGTDIVLNKNGVISIVDAAGQELESHTVPIGAVILIPEGRTVRGQTLPAGSKTRVEGEVFVRWDPYNVPIISEKPGRIEFVDIIENVTMKQEVDETSGQEAMVIIEHKEDLHPQIVIRGDDGEVLASYPIPAMAHVVVREQSRIVAGTLMAKTPRRTTKTKDITGGLPRVAELFEARRPKDAAEISKIDGVVDFGRSERGKRCILIRDPQTGVQEEHFVPISKHVIVFKGDQVRKGQQLTDGPTVPHEILDVCGPQELQEHLVNEVQEVYRLQGVTINDKHIEIIIRQMLRKVRITEPGDTDFLWGEQIDKIAFEEENQRVEKLGGKPAEAQPVLLGITKASLETESFLSAASFQDTTRVLTEAATMGKVDHLRGFKENVIMGHIIPAGTGFGNHRNVQIKPLVELPAAEEPAPPAPESPSGI